MKEERGKEGGGLSALGSFFMRIYSRVARNPYLFTVSQKFASLGAGLVSPFSDYVRLPALTGWGYSKDLPKFAGKTFRDRWNQLDNKTGKQIDRYTSKQDNVIEHNGDQKLRGKD
jgi:hypothetical protein